MTSDTRNRDNLAAIVNRFQSGRLAELVAQKKMVLTVTSGRSGTGLLSALLNRAAGIVAIHESVPMANIELRRTVNDPAWGLQWLIDIKLPQIVSSPAPVYVETSHIYCKAFIELFLMLGARPKFIILRRASSEVARSLFQMDVIPSRTASGRMVLLQPGDPGTLPLANWQGYSDFQMCYWYALEIERRQAHYAGLFRRLGIEHFDLEMGDLADWATFERVCRFIQDDGVLQLDYSVYEAILRVNQNPVCHHISEQRSVPEASALQERQVEWACAPYSAFLAVRSNMISRRQVPE
jgi:hypothetical protein